MEAIESDLEKPEGAGFIEPSSSPYLAPSVCVKKLNRFLRVTIDFFMLTRM